MAAVLLALAPLLGVPGQVQAVSGANGVQVNVSPNTIEATGEVMVTVTGSGFSTTENSGFGIYLSFGEQPAAGDSTAFTDANRYYNGGSGRGTIWVRPDTPSGPNQAKLNADGTFSVQVAVPASYTGADGVTYPRSGGRPLGVLAYAAHGTEVNGYSQRAFVPVTFVTTAPTATPRPATPPPTTPRPATPRPATPPPPGGGSPVSAATASPPGVESSDSASAEPSESTGASEAPSESGSASSSATEMTWRPSPSASSSAARVAVDDEAGLRIEPGQLILGAGAGLGLLGAIAAAVAARRQRSAGQSGE